MLRGIKPLTIKSASHFVVAAFKDRKPSNGNLGTLGEDQFPSPCGICWLQEKQLFGKTDDVAWFQHKNKHGKIH